MADGLCSTLICPLANAQKKCNKNQQLGCKCFLNEHVNTFFLKTEGS